MPYTQQQIADMNVQNLVRHMQSDGIPDDIIRRALQQPMPLKTSRDFENLDPYGPQNHPLK